jgi:hypothetical protein
MESGSRENVFIYLFSQFIRKAEEGRLLLGACSPWVLKLPSVRRPVQELLGFEEAEIKSHFRSPKYFRSQNL